MTLAIPDLEPAEYTIETTQSVVPTQIQSPLLIAGWLLMKNLIETTLNEKVFATLRNLVAMVKDLPDLNVERDQLLCSLENALSWEDWLADFAATRDGHEGGRNAG